MSALPPEADMLIVGIDFCYVPKADNECLGLACSAERDAVLVRRHPLVERLQLGIQRARELDAAVAGVEVVEVGQIASRAVRLVGRKLTLPAAGCAFPAA